MPVSNMTLSDKWIKTNKVFHTFRKIANWVNLSRVLLMNKRCKSYCQARDSNFAMQCQFVFTFDPNLVVSVFEDLTQSLNKRQKIRTMVRELSMTQVAHVGPYQAQLAHIPCWGRWGPWGGSGGVQSLKIGHFWTFLPDFPGLQNQVLGYFWVNWTLFDPHARFGEVSHVDFWSIMD